MSFGMEAFFLPCSSAVNRRILRSNRPASFPPYPILPIFPCHFSNSTLLNPFLPNSKLNKLVVKKTAAPGAKEKKLMNNVENIVKNMTLTVSCPFEMYVWIKQTQRNCSAYVVQAVEEKRVRDAQEATQ